MTFYLKHVTNCKNKYYVYNEVIIVLTELLFDVLTYVCMFTFHYGYYRLSETIWNLRNAVGRQPCVCIQRNFLSVRGFVRLFSLCNYAVRTLTQSTTYVDTYLLIVNNAVVCASS
jgi:hypothetical protein